MSAHDPTEAVTQNISPRPRERSGLLAWIGLGLIALAFLSYLKWRPLPLNADGVNHPVVGQSLKFLRLEPLTGSGEAMSASDLQGKVTLVNFWGTWCPPCVEEFPYLAKLYEQLRSSPGFQYLSISYDDKPTDELRESTGDFVQRMGADHPTYYDPGAATLLALHAIGVDDAFPTTVVVGRDGSIRGVWRGYNRSAIIEIEQLLKELLATAE